MIAKVTTLACLFGAVYGGGWPTLSYESSIGYGHGAYSTYVSPSYTAPVLTKSVYAAPVVTKAVVPTYAYAPYAPAISTVSQYQVHSSPVVKSYVAAPIIKPYVPIVKSYVSAPIVKSYGAPVSAYSSYSSAYPVVFGNDYNSGYAGGYSSDYYGGYTGYGHGGYVSKNGW